MPEIKQIDIRSIFEKASGHKLPQPKPYIVPQMKPIAGNLEKK